MTLCQVTCLFVRLLGIDRLNKLYCGDKEKT